MCTTKIEEEQMISTAFIAYGYYKYCFSLILTDFTHFFNKYTYLTFVIPLRMHHKYFIVCPLRYLILLISLHHPNVHFCLSYLLLVQPLLLPLQGALELLHCVSNKKSPMANLSIKADNWLASRLPLGAMPFSVKNPLNENAENR